MKKFIYFMLNKETGYIKIGESDDPYRRRLQVGYDLDTYIDLLVVYPQIVPIEAMLHDKFRHLRVEKEWFSPDSELLECIESLKGYIHPTVNMTMELEATIDYYRETNEMLKGTLDSVMLNFEAALSRN